MGVEVGVEGKWMLHLEQEQLSKGERDEALEYDEQRLRRRICRSTNSTPERSAPSLHPDDVDSWDIFTSVQNSQLCVFSIYINIIVDVTEQTQQLAKNIDDCHSRKII
jgi:hypothetical protein